MVGTTIPNKVQKTIPLGTEKIPLSDSGVPKHMSIDDMIKRAAGNMSYYKQTLTQQLAGLGGSLALHYPWQHQTVLANNVVTTNTLFALPFVVVRKMTLDRIGFRVVTGVVGNARVGIYNSDSNYNPSSLIVDSGELATDTSSTTMLATINQQLDVGLHYMAYLGNAAATIQGGATQNSSYVLGFSPTAALAGWRRNSFTYAPLPNPFGTISAAINANADMHGVLYRIASYP